MQIKPTTPAIQKFPQSTQRQADEKTKALDRVIQDIAILIRNAKAHERISISKTIELKNY